MSDEHGRDERSDVPAERTDATDPTGIPQPIDPSQLPEPPEADGADAATRGAARAGRRGGVLAGRITFICIVGAIVLIAAAGVTWVLTPGWGGGHKGSTTYSQRNIGDIPTIAPGSALAAMTISPNRIEIPRLGAVAPIITVQTTPDRELGVPLDPKIVGWWNGGAKPGAKTGTAILDGHINFSGVKGVLADIGTLNPGDRVYVYGLHNGRKTKVSFTITGVRTYDKAALPYQQIFDQKSIGRLAIVTCGGPFDASTGNYRDNIVAFAVPA
ncbi:MAG: hypothetical protein QOG80_563 [Pseudonocardiales bacterium]|jgi:hypothetical protein|nr:hypothetical protein [Pseudonocardiales bacterium]